MEMYGGCRRARRHAGVHRPSSREIETVRNQLTKGSHEPSVPWQIAVPGH
jgi:hypothetical protein